MSIVSGPVTSRRSQGGAVAIIVALVLVVLLGIAAFAIDIGRWFVVKNELQNGSDAAALAGAGYLYPPVATGPNWAAGVSEANSTVPLNTSEKVNLATGTVVPGYWDYSKQTFDSNTAKTRGAAEMPAVRVTVERRDGVNSGPVSMFFGRLFGTDTMNSSASATAVVAVPGEAGPGTLAPLAISNCIMTSSSPPLWDPAKEAPVGNPPLKFVIASGAAGGTHCNGCGCGQWTTFDKEIDSVPAVRDLIQYGNTSTIYPDNSGQIDVSDTWIQPGVEATLYDMADAYWTGKDILVSLVADDSLGKKGFTPVLGFACLHVFQVDKSGSNCEYYNGEGPLPGADDKKGKCMIVSFSTASACRVPGTAPVPGKYTGVSVPPRLVQ